MVDLFYYLEYYFYIVAVWDYTGNFLYAEALQAIAPKDLMDIYKEVIKNYLGDYILKQIENKGYNFFNEKIEKEFSVLFIDWHPFFTIKNNITPDKLLNCLDYFYDKSIDIILQNNGFVENIIGNSILSIFGLEDENYTNNSCISAIKILTIESELNKLINEADFIHFSIGITTSILTMKNIGSNKRFHFSGIGMGMNNSRRFQKMNREYNTKILIDKTTYDKTDYKSEFKLIDTVKQKYSNSSVDIDIFGI